MNVTFFQAWYEEWNANDSYQVFNRYKRPQNSFDPDGFTFTCMDQLR